MTNPVDVEPNKLNRPMPTSLLTAVPSWRHEITSSSTELQEVEMSCILM